MANDKIGYWAWIEIKTGVEAVNYTRETEAYIYREERHSEVRYIKSADYHKFFRTEQEAWNFLIEHQKRKIADARDMLACLSEGLESLEAKLKALPPTLKNPETKEE